MPEELTEEEKAVLNQTADIEEIDEQDAAEEEQVEPVSEAASEAAPEAASEPAEPPNQPQEQPQAGQATGGPVKPPEGFVPHQAMHAERERRKQLEVELAELREAQKPPAEAPPEYVDPIVDPEGHRKWSEFNSNKAQDAVKQFEAKQKENQRLAERHMRATAAEQEFVAREPDYVEAAQWGQDKYFGTLRAQGYTDDQIMGQYRKDMNDLYDAAQKIGMNPAELLFIRIKQAGWNRSEKPAPQADETSRVKALASVQAATQGITTTGAPQRGKLTLKHLSAMTEDELAQVPEKELKVLMGG